MGKRKEVHLQKLLNLDCHNSIRFGIFAKYLNMKNHSGRISPFFFLKNVLIETSNECFKNF